MLRYAEGLESGAVSIEEQVPEIGEESEEVHLVKLGWALKGASTSKRRFSEKQKQYLTDIFLLGVCFTQKNNTNVLSTICDSI